MCGIGGVVTLDGRADPDTLASFHRSLHHRGPDDHGWLAWNRGDSISTGRFPRLPTPSDVLLVHNRLSIIDLSPTGHQPMSTPDGRLHLIFNGEIYNYVELRAELEASYRFVGTSDTEVLLAAWAAWGPTSLDRLRGMFAFAVLDTLEQRLWLVRDPFGIKPLYFTRRRGSFWFASEIPALIDAGATTRRINPQGLYDFLHSGRVDHDGTTMLEGVNQLRPAQVASLTLDGSSPTITTSTYWSPPMNRIDRPFDEVVDDIRDRFRHSIRTHLRSDVPVGCALSGGIDSTAIICTMREELGPDAEIHAFSYVAEDLRYDEERWIDMAAERSGAIVHKVRISPDDLVEDAIDLIRSQGEPFGSTSILAQRCVFKAAKEHGVTVLLDGQGADELFGGYRSYLAGAFADLVRSGRWLKAARLATQVTRMPDVSIGRREIARVAAKLLPERSSEALLDRAGFGKFPPWMDREWFIDRGVDGTATTRPAGLDDTLAEAFSATSLPSLLRFEDRNSMRWSRESRVPFLEQDFVESVFRAPLSAIVADDGLTKASFRAAMRGTVPDQILDRRDKIGFTTPEDRWMSSTSPWVRSVLESDAALRIDGLDADRCSAHWGSVLSEAATFDWRVWRWINVILWAEALDLTS